MKNNQTTTEAKVFKNPSYDKDLSVDVRLTDFLGAYHVHLNGVVAHEPFMLTYEGKPNERCDAEEKQRIKDYVVQLVAHSQEGTEK